MVLDEYNDDYEDPDQNTEERLEEFKPDLHHEEPFRQFERQPLSSFKRRDDSPGAQEIQGFLLNGRSNAPRDPEYQQLESPTATERGSAMTEQSDEDNVQAAPYSVQSFGHGARRASEVHSLVLPDLRSEHERNELAIVSTNETGVSDASSSGCHHARLRVDSTLSEVQQPFSQRRMSAKCHHNDPTSARTGHRHPSINAPCDEERTISLPFRKDVVPATPSRSDTLPAIQTSPEALPEGSASSPQAGKLPGYQHLSELADAAVNDLAARAQPVHRQSISSQSSAAAAGQYGQYPGPVATSPTGGHYPAPLSAHSPTATSSTLSHSYGGSPLSQFPPPQPYFTDRRASHEMDRFGNHAPSLISSSSDSHYAGSSPEGYSTNHTTPTDPPVPSEINSRLLPAPANLHPSMIPGPFSCDHPDCKSVPFATQYLLNSHKNVHSERRPHYCPVKGCPRSEGGQGFKRKNEMIRHGLVHDSPGYVCPFCPEREHRYPRPDNLQRHVRVHHGDRSKDDPALQDVLAKRTEGPTKQRRRRTIGHIRGSG